MGMDVHGKTNDAYFRRNVWGWHGLADAIIDLYPALAAKVEYWHSNDGSGLNEADSKKLAGLIRADVASGRVAEYVAGRDAHLAALPREMCEVCHGKGMRTHEDNVRLNVAHMDYFQNWEPQKCNGCDGVGTKENWACSYSLEVQDLSEFADFLDECDGFEIW